jgi:pilus assembly protein CpaB
VSRGRRGLVLAGLAIVLGFLAAADVGRREDALARRLAPLVDVVVATRDLPAGRPLDPRRLAVRRVPARWAPAGAVGSPAELAGATLAVALPEGAYVTAMDLQAPTGLALRRGERAVEVVASGSPELVVAGARVDVLVTREGRGTRLALEDAEVLSAAAAPADASAPGARVLATLRVTLRQAVFLTEAQAFAREIRLLPR